MTAMMTILLATAFHANTLTATLTGYTIDTGTLASGTLSDLSSSDNQYLKIGSAAANGQQVVKLVVNAQVSPQATHPTSIKLTVEMHTSVRRQAPMLLWNVTTSNWDVVRFYILEPLTDSTINTTVPNASKYVSTSGAIKMMISCQPLLSNYKLSVDHVRFRVVY